MIAPENGNLLETLRLFIVATKENLAHFDTAPFDISGFVHIDPLDTGSERFLAGLSTLDAATFGPEGMPMPRWVFFDGAELPGGIVGFARQTADGLEPYSMFIAIPTVTPGIWMAHNLASIANLKPQEKLTGLGSLTKAVGLRVFRAHAQIGATQWASRALFVHTRLGALELLTAWTPAHSDPATLTYRASCDEPALLHLARDPSGGVTTGAPREWVSSEDHVRMKAIQRRIEAGERFEICGRPERSGDVQRLPIRAI